MEKDKSKNKHLSDEEKANSILEKTLRLQDEIYFNVTHELKTPLNVIFLANQLMDMQLNNDTFNKEKFMLYNNSIKQNCYRLIKLTNNIEDLSKCNAGYLNLTICNENIVELIENVINSVNDYIKAKNIIVKFDSNVRKKVIACDSEMIERAMLNLISNAVKFSNFKGEIFINLMDCGNIVEITVKDQGIGIKEKNLKSLFKRFYRVDKTLTRSAEGSGIGLPLVKAIIDLHEGNISVKSVEGEGSEFKIELPVYLTGNPSSKEKVNYFDNIMEKVHIEFSDIYTID